ncbi:Amino acid adenylation domain-containing protein [Sulfidibacter corallicola]|uniref:Amino acid adenylation domain-containing protein n=1 Tax=Sulfidibacter corallicola TaxID=2818388 RepID=A0A8A4TRL2_SULCO|nr:non-ribosomal peptide synthetase [Sulfidibacter corallicola]QTD51641.1 amino acid adenylation domain-containing protein [Sulfidibacter corallicola]
MEHIASRIAQLSPEKRALLEKELTRRRRAAALAKPNIPRREGSGPWPATVDQSAIWFFHQMDPATSAYNIGSGLRLHGMLDLELLARALDALVARHETLRLRLPAIDGRPYIEVVEQWNGPLEVLDLRDRPHPNKALQEEGTRLIREPFDLENGPLFRMPLLRITDDQWVLIAVLHHTITDWWTFQLFHRELFMLYAAFYEQEPPPFSPLPIQFVDWALWRERWLTGAEAEQQRAYWLERLEGAPIVFELPGDFARPPRPSQRGAREYFVLDETVLRAVREAGRRVDASSLVALLAATFAFLHRLSEADDILIGTPVSFDRNMEETRNLMGYLLNTVVFRGELHGDPDFNTLLERTRATVLGAFANKELPFRELVERMNPPRDMSRMPIYQVEFIYVSHEGELFSGHTRKSDFARNLPFSVEDYGLDRRTSPVDLQFSFLEGSRHIEVVLEYATDLFRAGTMARYARILANLIKRMLAAPETPISRLSLLSAEERTLVCEGWAEADAEWTRLIQPAEPGPCQTIGGMIEAAAARFGDRPAVVAGDETLTHAELQRQATNVAHHLIAQGVRPGDHVGVSLTRGPLLLPSLLGVLAAGAAYVPLDPAFPPHRLGFMARDANLRLILAERATRSCWDEGRHRCLDVATLLADPAEPARELPIPDPDTPAYLIYTSGSTGRPKGVLVPHRAVTAALRAQAALIDLSPIDRFLAVTTLSFDISAMELFLPLGHGATLVVADARTAADGSLLAEALEAHAITAMQATPATWRMMIDTGWTGKADLKVCSGGEALPADLAANLSTNNLGLWNLYGPTETTIWSAGTELAPGEPVTLGGSFPGERLAILDSHLEPLPPGLAGDLYISGEGLSLGYWRRPALTAAAFVPDPRGPAGARRYRTGDRATWDESGRVRFQGRGDGQVKLRGFRIETDEIRAHLLERSEIQDARVVIKELPGGPALAAYYLAERTPDAAVLRAHLAARVPGYMVPSFFVRLTRFPLTPNRKLDVSALPDPRPERSVSAAEVAVPRNDMERTLFAIWSSVLGSEAFGATDNFFEIGGHSLTATRIIARLREHHGMALSLERFFQLPTIADQARVLRRDGSKAQPPIPVAAPAESYPLSHAQRNLWLRDCMAQRTHPDEGTFSNNMVGAFRLVGAFDSHAFRLAWQALYRRHAALRTRFRFIGEEPRQVVLAQDQPWLEECVLGESTDAAAREAALTEHFREMAETAFDLERTTLLRLRVIEKRPCERLMVLCMHHLIGDGWSLNLLFQECAALYAFFKRGEGDAERLPLPRLRVQYHDYAVWQQGRSYERERAFWRARFPEAPRLMALPSDGQTGARAFSGGTVSGKIDAEVRAALGRLALRHEVSVAGVVLAAFKLLLAQLCGTEEVTVGVSAANRAHSDLDRVIGFFVNPILVRTTIPLDGALEDLLAEVAASLTQALDHSAFPFDLLVDELNPSRAGVGQPLFNVSFAYQNFAGTVETEGGGASLEGLSVEVVTELPLNTAKFDLTLFAYELDSGLELRFEYATRRFDEARIATYLTSLIRYLGQMASLAS